MDLGGPGAPAPTISDVRTVRAVLPDWLNDANILVLAEPWTDKRSWPDCERALWNRYRAHAENKTLIEDVVGPCGLSKAGYWGFSKESYTAHLADVEEREGIRFDVFVGVSFGAQRLLYLADRDWRSILLARPFPVGTSASDYLLHRADMSAARVRAVLPEFTATTPEGASFVLGSAYLKTTDLQNLGSLGRTDMDELQKRVAAQLWQIYGDRQVSVAALAYLDEVCPALRDWKDRRKGRADGWTVRDAVFAYHEPCVSVIRERGAASQESTAGQAEERIQVEVDCLIVDTADAVSPSDLLDSSILVVKRNGKRIDVSNGEHHDVSAFRRCRAP